MLMGKSTSYKCITCNAPLKYNSKSDLFICEYCGNKFTINDLNEYHKKLELINKQKVKPKTINVDSYHCENCGANIILGKNTASTSCVYCKSSAIIKDRLDGVYAPSKIITFNYNKEDAINKFKELCHGRKLMPNDFDNPKNIQDMEGLYVPFWLYNCNNKAVLYASCNNVTTWSDSRYIHTKTDYYKVTVDGTLSFDNIPNDAASRFDDKIMHAIEPFDYTKFKDFNLSYLSGYISEKYDVLKEDAFVNTKRRIDDDSKNYLLNKITGFDSKSIDSYNSSIAINSDDYVLLPVWVLNIKYRDQIYHFAMNGQTGKLVGEIPVDKKKLFLLIMITFILSFIIIFLLFYIGGRL